MRPAFVILFAGLLAGCAQGGLWSKEGVSDEDRQRDIVDCRRQADAEAERASRGAGMPAPIYEIDPNTGQVRQAFRTQNRSAALSERSRSEELYLRCMKARGYRQQ